MSLIELAGVFTLGLALGVYSGYYARPMIEMGIGLIKLQKKENDMIDKLEKEKKEKELKPMNDQTNAANQPGEASTTLHPTQEQNH